MRMDREVFASIFLSSKLQEVRHCFIMLVANIVFYFIKQVAALRALCGHENSARAGGVYVIQTVKCFLFFVVKRPECHLYPL